MLLLPQPCATAASSPCTRNRLLQSCTRCQQKARRPTVFLVAATILTGFVTSFSAYKNKTGSVQRGRYGCARLHDVCCDCSPNGSRGVGKFASWKGMLLVSALPYQAQPGAALVRRSGGWVFDKPVAQVWVGCLCTMHACACAVLDEAGTSPGVSTHATVFVLALILSPASQPSAAAAAVGPVYSAYIWSP
jgi:hypothetical protein